MSMNNCFRVVLGCVVDWQQETSWPYCLFWVYYSPSEIGSVVKTFILRQGVAFIKRNRILVFVAAILMAAFLATWSGSHSKVQAQERQPHMQAALRHLQEAQEELRAAEHDKGGHRANAMKLVESAITEVDAGIHYADKH